MDDREDPISQFFPGQESVDLYAVLSLTSDAKLDDIKKAYRRLALVYHPDKQATATEDRKAEASTKFQQIGFAYAVLSDEKRRQRYDSTGKTDEGFDMGAGEDGWDAYFEELFDRVTRGKLDEMKKEYQGQLLTRHNHLCSACIHRLIRRGRGSQVRLHRDPRLYWRYHDFHSSFQLRRRGSVYRHHNRLDSQRRPAYAAGMGGKYQGREVQIGTTKAGRKGGGRGGANGEGARSMGRVLR